MSLPCPIPPEFLPTPKASTVPPPTPMGPIPQSQESYLYSPSPVIPAAPILSNVPLPPHTSSPIPSSPCSVSTVQFGPHTPFFHPLLCHSHRSGPELVWDMRTDPTPASLFHVPTSHDNTWTTSVHVPIPVSGHELYQPATDPPRCTLRLFCGVVAFTSTWGTITVTASASSGMKFVTVLDVLNAVRECMRTPIIQEEWDALCEKQQGRVSEMFDSRWRMSVTPAATRENGVLRQDCLLLHTLWGGLTPSFVESDAAVLTLRRLAP